MDVDAFWELIERSRQETGDQDARLEWLQRQLAWQRTAEIVGLGRDAFERVVVDPDNLASLPEVVGLAGRPMGDWSSDDRPDWEALGSVAWAAYEQVTGEEEGIFDAMEVRGHHSPSDPDPTGQRWDFEDPAEAARRLPRLSWMFPLTDRATRDQLPTWNRHGWAADDPRAGYDGSTRHQPAPMLAATT